MMISKRIEGSLDEALFKTLLILKKCMWTNSVTGVQEFDGPTMLQLIVSSINPTTCVDVSTHKIEIQTATLQKFGNNVQEMVDL